MELFHQTVSMTIRGEPHQFVRDHMLEPFDADKWTAEIVTHFDEYLTKARRSSPAGTGSADCAVNPLLEEVHAVRPRRSRDRRADRAAESPEVLLRRSQGRGPGDVARRANCAPEPGRLLGTDDARRGELESQLTVLRDRVGTLNGRARRSRRQPPGGD